MAQALERACFDYIMIEDKLMVPETYGGSRDYTLQNAMIAPKHDPAPLATAMGMATSRLGVVATLSTLSYPPFLLARLSSTIDSLTGGRFGWNIVTSAEDLAAQITAQVSCPTVGIGASATCDGQILVTDDMLGMFEWTPRFVRRYADLRNSIATAVDGYASDVRSRAFPGPKEIYTLKKAP